MEVVPWIMDLSMSPEAKKITYVSSPLTNLHWYRHVSIRYEFYIATQIQTIIKTETPSFS